MADFNPYREWLGVTAPGQPPDHYALLGLKRFEEDAAAVRRAADAQKSRVRSIRPGPHAAEWSRLLDQLDAARDCLASPDKRAAYDDQLRKQPLPEESVLEDPVEQAPTAASSIVADSADSDVAKTNAEDEKSTGQPQRVNQPVKNLLPPGFGPDPEPAPDRDLSTEGPEPADSQPVESLTKNILPPTFGTQQPAAATTSPTPDANAPATNPSAPSAPASNPAAPIANPAPLVETPSTNPPAEASLPQNPAPVVASPSAPTPSPSAPVASAAPMGNASQQPTAAPAGGYAAASQTPQTPFSQIAQPQPQHHGHEDDDDDLLPPMAIPISGSPAGSATNPGTAQPASSNLASPIPVGTAMGGSAWGAPMGAPVGLSANQPTGSTSPTPATQLTGPSYGDAFGASDSRSDVADTASSPMVTAQTPVARAAAGRSRLSTSSLVAIAASLVLLLAAGGIFVRNRLASEQNPEVSRLDGLHGSPAGQPDGNPASDLRTQPQESPIQPDGNGIRTDGGSRMDDSDENVRPATVEQPVDDRRPAIEPGSINHPSPESMSSRPSTDPRAASDPNQTPERGPIPNPGPTADPGPVTDPGVTSNPRPAPDPGPSPLAPDRLPFDPPPEPADSSANPVPNPMPEPTEPPEPALSDKLMIDFNWTLKEVRGHLTDRDLYTAKVLIGRAKEIAKKGKPGPHMEKLERLELLTHYLDEFWGAVLDGLPELEGKDLEVGSTVVHIQQVSQNAIAYRAQGRNFKKQRYEWPSGLVRAIAENWLDETPKSKIFVGAFMAVDKSYGIEKAREQWEKALAGDTETAEAVRKVMPVLNEL